jgi:hypothetical protein
MKKSQNFLASRPNVIFSPNFIAFAKNNTFLLENVDVFGSIEGEEVPPVDHSQLIAPDTKNWTAFDAKNFEDENADPFDTTFVESVQPGKCELKLLENEILGDIGAGQFVGFEYYKNHESSP